MSNQVARTEEEIASGKFKYIDADLMESIWESERIEKAKRYNRNLLGAIIIRYVFAIIGLFIIYLDPASIFVAWIFFIPAVISIYVRIFNPERASKFRST